MHELKSRSFRAGALVLGPLLLLLLCGAAAPPDQAAGAVTGVRGSVTRKRLGAERTEQVRPRDVYRVGEVLATGSGSAAQLALSDETFLNLAADSAVRVNQYSFDPATLRRTARVKVLRGLARVVLFRPRSADSLFHLETAEAIVLPDMIADVVVEARDGETFVAVLGGSAAVKNASSYVIGEMRLGMHQSVVIRPKTRPEQPAALRQEEQHRLLGRLRVP
jgi:ferric-dicitrate binding protein FerR (iron transport regulator)